MSTWVDAVAMETLNCYNIIKEVTNRVCLIPVETFLRFMEGKMSSAISNCPHAGFYFLPPCCGCEFPNHVFPTTSCRV